MSNPFDLSKVSENFPDISSEQIEKLKVYLNELVKWNKSKSLTRIPVQEMVAKLILPSLWIGRFCLGNPGFRVLDLGSGAGIPGIPISIISTDQQIVLLDRSQKKISFLKHLIRLLKLQNVETECMDGVEYIHTPGAAGSFDRIFSRSTGPTEEVLKLSAQLLKNNGILILQKGGRQLQQMQEFPWESVRNEFGLQFLESTAIGAWISLSEGTLWLIQKPPAGEANKPPGGGSK